METKRIFTSLLRIAITADEQEIGELCNEPLEIDHKALFEMAKLHDLAHLVSRGLALCKLVPPEQIAARYKKEESIILYRYMRLTSEARSLYALLDSVGAPYMVLKGAGIRKYYPRPEMRVSSDIDILVHRENLDAVLDKLRASGYTTELPGEYDVSAYSQSGVHVEVHFKLTSEEERYDPALSSVWESSLSDTDSELRRVMNPELMLAYTIMHAAKHFYSGGCGARFVLDHYILTKNMSFDEDTVIKILEKCRLTKFYAELSNLAQVWFSSDRHTDLTLRMEDYILGSGIYGNIDNVVAVRQKERGGKFKYALNRIFPPVKYIAMTYPVLNKYPILYPVCLVRRFFRIIFLRRKAAVHELRINASLNDKKTEHLRQMLGELDLK